MEYAKKKQSFLGVSVITPPLKGCRVLRRCLGSIPKIIFVNFIIFVISGIEVACRSKEEGELYKNYKNYNFYIKGVIDIIYIYARTHSKKMKKMIFLIFLFLAMYHFTTLIA